MVCDNATAYEGQQLRAVTSRVAHVAGLVGGDFDGHDPWGSAAQIAFACADMLYVMGEDIPADWQYSPGIGSDDRTPGDVSDEYGPWVALNSPDWLRMTGTVAVDLMRVCEELELNY